MSSTSASIEALLTPPISKQPHQCLHCLIWFSTKNNLDTHLKKQRCKVVNYKKLKKLARQKKPDQTSQSSPSPAQPVTNLGQNIDMSSSGSEMSSLPSDDLPLSQTDLRNLMIKVAKLEQNQQLGSQAQVINNQQLGSQAQVINNQANNLSVLCLTSKDDLLEMLTTGSNLKNALTFIKNCALSQLQGDCRLIRKIYLDIPKPALMYANKSKTQFVYYDENRNRTVETNARVIAKILAENVQRSYLKGSSSLKDEEGNLIAVKSDHPYLPKLDPHDLDMWNAHIYELNDEKYQKKVLNSLSIPFESDINSTQT